LRSEDEEETLKKERGEIEREKEGIEGRERKEGTKESFFLFF
jgi:hypothetical protein